MSLIRDYGTDGVWYTVLSKLGYTKEEINDSVAVPGFQAWWLMNNLEGWGGPNPDSWYKQQIALQIRIVKRMREYGIEPVFPGYSGMVPHNAKEKLVLNVSDPGLWNGWRLVQCAEQVRLYEGRNQRFCSRSRFPGLVVDEQLGRLGRPESG